MWVDMDLLLFQHRDEAVSSCHGVGRTSLLFADT